MTQLEATTNTDSWHALFGYFGTHYVEQMVWGFKEGADASICGELVLTVLESGSSMSDACGGVWSIQLAIRYRL